MALSDWDKIGIRVCQKPPIDEVKEFGKITLGDVSIEVHKSYLWLNDKAVPAKNGLLRIEHGEVEYKDVYIVAFRGPQQGIYAVVWTGSEYSNTIEGAILCGVYGYQGHEEESLFIGVTKESLQWFMDTLKKESENNDLYIPKVFLELDLTKAERCNAGDEYILNKLGINTIATTSVGQAQEPIIMQILKNKKEKESECA